MNYYDFVNLLLEIAAAHPLIKSTLWEQDATHGTQEAITYPYFILEYPMNPIVVNDAKTYKVAFLIVDRPNEGPDNLLTIMGKTERIAQDIVQTYFNNDLLEVSDTYNMLEITNEFADRVSGWRVEVDVTVPANHNCFTTI